jgi:hypothetical protein
MRWGEETPFDDIGKTVMEGKKPRDPVSTKAVRSYICNHSLGDNL